MVIAKTTVETVNNTSEVKVHNKKNTSEVKDHKNNTNIKNIKTNNYSKPAVANKKVDLGGGLDEKGNPLPIASQHGGPPTCPRGYKIDTQFDPINDPINPPFRCIPTSTIPPDGIARKLSVMANNPSSGVENLAKGKLPRGNLPRGNLPRVGVIRGGRGGRGPTRETKRRRKAHRTRSRLSRRSRTTTT